MSLTDPRCGLEMSKSGRIVKKQSQLQEFKGTTRARYSIFVVAYQKHILMYSDHQGAMHSMTSTGINNLLLFNEDVKLLFRPPVVPLSYETMRSIIDTIFSQQGSNIPRKSDLLPKLESESFLIKIQKEWICMLSSEPDAYPSRF